MRFLLALCLVFGAVACGDSSGPGIGDNGGAGTASTGTGEDDEPEECEDEDGDGFGDHCKKGRDCNDDDPEDTDLCFRCNKDPHDEDCPCDKGTKPMFCIPPDIVMNGQTYVCSEGSKYCRDEMWSVCEVTGEYVLQQ